MLDVNILGLLGAALGERGRFAEAEDVLLRVIDLTPTFAKPYEDLGTLLLQQGKAEQAIGPLEKAARLDPNLEAAHFHLGKALALLGRGPEADAAFERSFALSPTRGIMAPSSAYTAAPHTPTQTSKPGNAGEQGNQRRLLKDAIELERELLSDLRDQAHVVDTSQTSAANLRSHILSPLQT